MSEQSRILSGDSRKRDAVSALSSAAQDWLTEIERITLVLLYAPGKRGLMEPIRSRLHLAKQIFILWKNPHFEELHSEVQFEPYHFGPWSDSIDGALAELASRGLIEVTKSEPIRFALTADGKRTARKEWESLTAEERAVVTDVKKNLGSLATPDLLRLIYSAYPEYAKESKYQF